MLTPEKAAQGFLWRGRPRVSRRWVFPKGEPEGVVDSSDSTVVFPTTAPPPPHSQQRENPVCIIRALRQFLSRIVFKQGFVSSFYDYIFPISLVRGQAHFPNVSNPSNRSMFNNSNGNHLLNQHMSAREFWAIDETR